MIVLPPEVGVQLGLGPRFQVVPFEYKWVALDMTTTEGPEKLYVLTFTDPGGVRGYGFSHDDQEAFSSQALTARTGLVLPTNGKGIIHGNA